MKTRGFTLIELMIVISIMGILALVALPNFSGLRQRAYDSSAQSAAYNCKIAQEIFYLNSGGSLTGYFATSLNQLTAWDKNLNKDASVTFLFNASGYTSGYTFTTHHMTGSTNSQGYFVISN